MYRDAEQKLQNPLIGAAKESCRGSGKRLGVYGAEVLMSLLVVCGLFWVAFGYTPTVTVDKIERFPFERRDAFYSVAAPEGNIISVAGSFGKIVRSEDGGRTWTIQSTPTENHLQKIAAWDETSLLAVGDKNTVLVTRDGGREWQLKEVPSFPWGKQLLSTYTDSASGRAWIVGNMGTVLYTDDFGESWGMIHPEEDVVWNDVTLAGDGSLWVAGEFGALKRTTDNGQTWETIEVPTSSSLNAITFSTPENGVIAGLSGTLLVTEDAGTTWDAVETGVSTHLYDILWDGKTYRAVGDGGMLLTSEGSGREWRSRKLAPRNYSWYTEITPIDGGYLISGAGAGVYRDESWKPFVPGRKNYRSMFQTAETGRSDAEKI